MTQKLLYVGSEFDYGDKNRGLSHEHRNIHHSLLDWCRRQGWRCCITISSGAVRRSGRT